MNETAMDEIIKLAKECPSEYPVHGDWYALQCVQSLSNALLPNYPALSDAVKRGKWWAHQIAMYDDEIELKWLEDEAAEKWRNENE